MFGTRRERGPVQRLEGELHDKRALRDNIAARLNKAEELVAEKRAAAQQAAMSGGADATLDRADGELRAAEDRGRTLGGALARMDSAIIEVERELSSAIEQRDRAEVASALETMADAITRASPKYIEAAQGLSEAIRQSNVSIPQTEGLVKFLDGTRREIASAVAMIDAELRSRAVGVRAGTMKFTKQVAPTEPMPQKPEPARETVYSLDALRWTENGTVRTCPSFAEVSLPVDVLSAALRGNHADYVHSQRAKNVMGAYGNGHGWVPLPHDDPRLVDLDALAAQHNDESETVTAAEPAASNV